MDVIPAGLRSEGTGRYIVDVINRWEEVRVQYAFPNGWGAHVRFVRGPVEDERWDVSPGFCADPITERPDHALTRRSLSTRDTEEALLTIRGYRALRDDVMTYVDDLFDWSHPLLCECSTRGTCPAAAA